MGKRTTSQSDKKAVEQVNKELSKYGEHIDENEECFRAMLHGTLDRLVYDEGRMTPEEAEKILGLLEGVKDPFEIQFEQRTGKVLTGAYYK